MTDVNELYVKLGQDIMKHGQEVKTRGTVSKECIGNQHVMDLKDPLVVTLKNRNLKSEYVKAELEWYLSGSLKCDDIAKAAPFWSTIKDDNGNVVSNYGYWIFHHEEADGKTRFDRCVELLVADPDTRKAIINIHEPINSVINPKDTPCTLALQFLIRNGQLHMIVTMRSNDLVTGWCNDILQFQFIALLLYSTLKFKFEMDIVLGSYIHQAASLHIYDKHYDRTEWTDRILVHNEQTLEFSKALKRTIWWLLTKSKYEISRYRCASSPSQWALNYSSEILKHLNEKEL